jgi:hypothetical protein
LLFSVAAGISHEALKGYVFSKTLIRAEFGKALEKEGSKQTES